MFLLLSAPLRANPHAATISSPPLPESGYFKMGTARNPEGREITVDSLSLRWDGQPWVPAMGEFHFTRYPAAGWREELFKMKAGGIDIVATYVFWIHHEESEGQWDWSGDRHLRRFVEAAREAGLLVIVRMGPWCHGEVRNGGIPEWAATRKGWRLRSTDPNFLEAARTLYGQIARQLRGLLWKEGGPVIGVQVDNEYGGPAEYLVALKKIARECGIDVPLYTRTGWPALSTPMPLGEILPLYGAYAEGFWDREVTPMPGRYWSGFHFSTLRSDANIANELLGRRDAKDDDDVAKYPYLTCEIGGGMMNSYHRRILIDPLDVESTTLVKVGSGSTGPGYYMYHGGTNPEGRLTTLMEAQDTVMTNYNDMPVKNYDFQAPLGQFGQIRPHYHTLRRLHYFLDDHGADLATMSTTLPEQRPHGKEDVDTLRWSVRSNGRSGFVFFNNYERLKNLLAKKDVQFALTLADGRVQAMPTQPITIPENAMGWWPFHLEVHGLTIVHATAQPFSHILEENGTRTLFFAETPGVAVEFAVAGARSIETDGAIARDGEAFVVRGIKPGRAPAIRARLPNGRETHLVVLSDADSRAFWKGPLAGRNRVVLTSAGVVFESGGVRLTASAPAEIAVFPAVESLQVGDAAVTAARRDGGFSVFRVPLPATPPVAVEFERVRDAGPAREIRPGPIREPVPQMPTDDDFAAAAEWRVTLPANLTAANNPLLRFHYAGDVARIHIGDRFATDDYFNGRPVELGLRQFAPRDAREKIRIEILPLRKDAPIYLAKEAWPEFGDAASHVALRKVELIQETTVTVTAK